ncbi:MAG: DUF4465 domain-containing protein [Muribaculaceae bacterium]|nr:DUF4465 domain-containing protein [Muribaculaceae bacterium]
MKKFYKLTLIGFSAFLTASMVSCADDKDEPDHKEPDETYETATIGFEKVPENLIGGPTTYGANLYYGYEDQIEEGYLAQIYGDTYAQFPVNYGYTYDADYNNVWGYSYFNGGFAVSNWHDMTDDAYMNQLSVYNSSSPSGGNFLVAFCSGTVSDITNATYSDFAGAPKVYITDAKGYYVANPGSEALVTGEDNDAFFESVYINNTTYVYKVMENGNAYASKLDSENEGWFKVQFIAFDDADEPDAKPLGYTEAYLANFKKGQADDYEGLIDTWTKVDLSMLPECSVLVINFQGSDMGEYGLNTPGYCALDKFEISVEK